MLIFLIWRITQTKLQQIADNVNLLDYTKNQKLYNREETHGKPDRKNYKIPDQCRIEYFFTNMQTNNLLTNHFDDILLLEEINIDFLVSKLC
jgi:hypothetical protein